MSHLEVTKTDRGFSHMPPIQSDYPGGSVRVYESSAATGQYVWLTSTAPANLNDPEGPAVKAPIHLTAEDALRVADQLCHAVANHYQFSETGFDGPLGEMADRVSDAIATALRLLVDS